MSSDRFQIIATVLTAVAAGAFAWEGLASDVEHLEQRVGKIEHTQKDTHDRVIEIDKSLEVIKSKQGTIVDSQKASDEKLDKILDMIMRNGNGTGPGH